MEQKVEFNQEYFEKVVEETAKEQVNQKNTEKVLSRLDKNSLLYLFKQEGGDFYRSLMGMIGYLRAKNLRDKNYNKALDELRASTGLDGEDLEKYVAEMEAGADTPLNGINTIKLVCSKLLGFIKVVRDTAIIGFGFTTRVSVKLLCNIGKALKDTGEFAFAEAKCAGGEIKNSWEFNMK